MISTAIRYLAIIFLISTLSGCAMWPSVKSDSKLVPSDAKSAPCITDNIDDARKCALLTVEEIGNLLENTGDYDRGAAYVALGLATGTGGVLAYNKSENALKGLAVASGGLLGLNSVVNTKQQHAILEKGLKEMTCSIRAADALLKSSAQIKSNSTLASNLLTKLISADLRTGALSSDASITSLNEGAKALTMLAKTKEAIHLESLSKSVVSSYGALDAAQTSIGTKLSNAVIEIRASLRSGLASLSPSAEDLLKTQSSRIVDMTGEIVRRRSELEKKQTDQPVGDDPVAKKAAEDAKQFVINTANVVAVSRDCVDPATQREIEK